MSRRVVVTGMGAITPIGNSVEEFWNGLKEKKVGIAPITYFDTTDYKGGQRVYRNPGISGPVLLGSERRKARYFPPGRGRPIRQNPDFGHGPWRKTARRLNSAPSPRKGPVRNGAHVVSDQGARLSRTRGTAAPETSRTKSFSKQKTERFTGLPMSPQQGTQAPDIIFSHTTGTP